LEHAPFHIQIRRQPHQEFHGGQQLHWMGDGGTLGPALTQQARLQPLDHVVRLPTQAGHHGDGG
jgi:hypothetical protein